MTKLANETFDLTPEDNDQLMALCGQLDMNLDQIESQLSVAIAHRSYHFTVSGSTQAVKLAKAVLLALFEKSAAAPITEEEIRWMIQYYRTQQSSDPSPSIQVKTRQGMIEGRTPNQRDYMSRITKNSMNFGIGPAGTGKTYLAVALAVAALEEESVERILLVRPAVEAGEHLGFLPGGLSQKIDPYLRPLYDALHDMLGVKRVERLLERQQIELAPLAYMRGRTLNRSIIILDESQNTTREQMKMFLTRLGFGSTAIITGDLTQIDLPKGIPSGLLHAAEVLSDVEGVSFTYFEAGDVVRHPLVQKIITAYESHETAELK